MKKVIIIVMCLFLTGCFDGREIEELNFVIAIGIGKAPNGYRYTFQLANPVSTGASQESEGGEGQQAHVEMFTVDANSIYTAINILNAHSSKGLTLGLLKMIIIDTEIAQEGISPLLEQLMVGGGFTPDVFLAVSLCSPDVFLGEVKPRQETNIIKYYDFMFGKYSAHVAPKTHLGEAFNSMQSLSKDLLIPLVNVNSIKSMEDLNGVSAISKDDKHMNYIAGQTPQLSENGAEILGGAVFLGDKKVRELGAIECLITSILQGEYKKGYFTLDSEEPEIGQVTLELFQPQKPKIKSTIHNGLPQFYIKVNLHATVSGTNKGTEKNMDFERVIKLYQQTFEKKTMEVLKLSQSTGSDFLALGDKAKRNFWDYNAYKEYNWQEKLPSARFTVKYEFKLKGRGEIERKSENPTWAKN